MEKKIKWNCILDEFLSLLGLAVVEAACRLRLTAKTWIISRASPCEFCCRRIGTGVGFCPIYSVLSCQDHSTIAVFRSTSGLSLSPLKQSSAPSDLGKQSFRMLTDLRELE
jgi:hypothetical protein